MRIVNLDLCSRKSAGGGFGLCARANTNTSFANDAERSGIFGQTAPLVDGLIGLDVLRGKVSALISAEEESFSDPRTLRSSARMEVDEAYLAVDVQMLNRPVRLLLDTGVSAILLYRDRMGDRLPEVRWSGRFRASMGGAASLEVSRCLGCS